MKTAKVIAAGHSIGIIDAKTNEFVHTIRITKSFKRSVVRAWLNAHNYKVMHESIVAMPWLGTCPKLSEFEHGEILLVLQRHVHNKHEVNEVEVTAINYNNNGHVTYSGRNTGQGAFDPAHISSNDDPRPTQTIIHVEKTGATRTTHTSLVPAAR